MFNLSVLVTDAFMAAIKEDAPWELKFSGTTYKVLPARELWDKIMRATYAYAEPGVIFIDRINRRNNLHYCRGNPRDQPVVTADTWVQTSEGPRQVAELIGKKFTALVEGQKHRSGPEGFFATGVKPVCRSDDERRLYAAADRRSQGADGGQPRAVAGRPGMASADRLSPGDLVVIHNHGASVALARRL